MNKDKRIVIVTEKEEQLSELACAFLRHGKTNLELYSDAAFIREPQTIDWMVVDEQIQFFVPVIDGTVFVLSTEESERAPGKKYLDGTQKAEVIYQQMLDIMSHPTADQMQKRIPEPKRDVEERYESKTGDEPRPVTFGKTRLYISTSQTGGTGKTEGTILLGKLLARQGKQVFYMNLEEEQDFGYFLQDTEQITEEEPEKSLEELIEQGTGREEGFTYLKPIQTELTEEQMVDRRIRLISSLIKLQKYDVILAELPCKKEWYTWCMQGMIDKMLVFTRQDRYSAQKLRKLEREKENDLEYLYICGIYDKNRKNYLEDMDITEYVPYIEKESVEELLNNNCMKTTAEILK